MKDFLGNELRVGDSVAYISQSRTSAWLSTSKVVGFTACFVKVEETGWDGKPIRVCPTKVVKQVTQ